MRLYEHEAKQVLAEAGLKVPPSFGLVKSAKDLARCKIRYPAMIKAQVLVGGRGKAGGVVKADSPDRARALASRMLTARIGGYPVAGVLVEAALESSAACYLAVTLNPATFNSVIMASPRGGVDIEAVARTDPQAILRIELPDNPDALPRKVAAEVADFLTQDAAVPKHFAADLAAAAAALYAAYQGCDCKVAEINPLLITASGVVAADAKIVLDDNALFRQGKLLKKLGIADKRHEVAESTAREKRSAEAGFPYLDLLAEAAAGGGDKVYVGLVPGGAGYGIFSIDEVTGIGEQFFSARAVPVNFMDSGGGPTRQGVAEMFSLLMDYPLVDVIITSRFGGISSCDVFIRGLIDCLRRRAAEGKRIVPVYGRMVGTDLAAARAYLDQARRQTPEQLAPLSMVVGNKKIMADVIKDGLEDFLARRKEATE